MAERKRKEASVAYRVKCLDTTIDRINRALMENADPRGALVSNLVERTNSESEAIREELKKFSKFNVQIHISSIEFNDVEPQSGADPAVYKQDLDYILAQSEYKYCQVDNTVTQRMRLIDIAKASIQTRIATLQGNSQPTSRNIIIIIFCISGVKHIYL